MSTLEMYLFTRLDTINAIFYPIMVVGLMALLVTSAGCFISDLFLKHYTQKNNEWEVQEWGVYNTLWKAGCKITAPLAVIALLIVLLIPTQKEAAAIYLVPRICNSEAAKELSTVPADAVKILKLRMNQYLNELQPQTNQEKK